ncbi:MAG: glucosamine-6-phosphate deaminase, partial [Tidjanibacter sp.]|nr:glucosamine-6-phosphate deaminase [Tidjanibacter sp.]
MLLREFTKDTMRVCVYDSRRAMGLGAAEEAIAFIKDLLSKQPEANIIFAAAPSQNEFLEAM